MPTLAWIAAGLVLGSLPFSFWLGRIFLHKDITAYGDHAPGATNVARAGGRVLYIVAILMDAFKGTIPVWLAQLVSHVGGWGLAAVAVAPVLAHAFSPFLKFRGGMGVATTFGVWLGMLGCIGPVVMGICTGLMFGIQKNWVWASVGTVLGLLVFVLIFQGSLHLTDACDRLQLATICVAHAAIQAGKRYTYFKSWPELQTWLSRRRTGK